MQPRNSSASALGLLCHSKSCCKQQIPASHHRYTTASCAPARRDVDRVFCPLVRSFLRVASPGQYALMLWLFSCRCDSSFRDGRRPGRFVLRSPGSAFPIRNRGFLRVGGDALAVSSRGIELGLLQIRSHNGCCRRLLCRLVRWRVLLRRALRFLLRGTFIPKLR